jgi:microcompartment protein CcmK/EutM
MEMIRTLNIVTLTCLLILTGCFGLADDAVTPPAEGQEPTSTTANINHVPNINVYFNPMLGVDENRVMDIATNITSTIGANISMYHSAIDIDGDAMTMGWDIDLDGIIDVNVSTQSGFTTLYLPLAAWHTVPGASTELTTTVAFVAFDSNGAGTSELINVNTPQFAPIQNYHSTLYIMDAEDANGSPSDGIEDNLVRVTMTQGRDLDWAAISVKISVNNGAPVTCDNPGATGGGCVLVEFGDTTDQVWSVGDGVTIVESSALCAAGEVCSISVTITDTQEGKTLDESSAVAE